MLEDFFNWLDLDQISYWIGFLSGIVFLWVLRRAMPAFKAAGRLIVERFNRLRESLTTSTENRLRADVLKIAQKRHLAQALCALDEIVIAPKILLPVPQMETRLDTPELETAEELIPFLPEFSYLSAAFSYPGYPIARIFQRGANFLLLGSTGTGKSAALAYLASQLARRDPELGELSDYLPLYVDAADLLELHTNEITAFDLCHAVISRYASAMTQTRLNQVLENGLENGQAFLIVDSVDELPPAQVSLISNWLKALLTSYPKTRVIVAASPVNHDDLLPLGLHPAGLIGWGPDEKRSLFAKWRSIWQEVVHSQPLNPFNTVDPIILENWLANSPHTESPLAFTLRLWALTAGDLLGPNELPAIEAYIRRTTQELPESRKFLAAFAFRLVQDMKVTMNRSDLQNLAAVTVPFQGTDIDKEATEIAEPGIDQTNISPSGRMINDLIASGVLREVGGGSITFSSIIFPAFMLSEQLFEPVSISNLLNQPRWEFRQQSLWRLAAAQDLSKPFLEYLDQSNAPLENTLIETGHWLQFADRSNNWTAQALRILASQLQNTEKSLTFRFRVLGILAASENKSVDILFRRMLGQNEAHTRMLGSLGCGLLQDIKAIPELKDLLTDPEPVVRKSACLALGAIGGSQAVESIAVGLLQHDEALQKCAAEMLATDQDEGHAALQEGSEFNDLLVRRAVVFGLKKLNSEWSRELLAKMQMEDSEWVVRNAAEQALEQLEALSPAIPSPLPELMNTSWIIEFASQQGLGVASHEAAVEMLIQTLQQGSEVQQADALHRSWFLQDISEGVLTSLYSLYYGTRDTRRELAYLALWLLSGRHIELPEPALSGFHR